MNDTTQLLGSLKNLMAADDYPVAGPVAPDVMTDLMDKTPPAEWEPHKKAVYGDIQRLVSSRPDYAEMLSIMDGFEYNGLTMYNLVQGENDEPLWSNIYIRNFEARDSEIYVDPNLTDKVLIGEDGMSLFAYSFDDNCFEIRDKASTDYVIESHENFSDFLSALIETVS